jgi:osmoprotectant transport system substrate-binding protein
MVKDFTHPQRNAPSFATRAGSVFATRAGSVFIVCLLLLLTACAPPRGSGIVIGAKNFTEQVLLGELVAQEIETVAADAGKPEHVGRRFYLAGSYICQQALLSGRIDGYVEYSGTALTAILKQPQPRTQNALSERASVIATITRLYLQKFHVTVEPSLGFEDTFAMVVRGSEAERLGLHTISDAVKDAGQMRLGVGYEFQSRPDGLAGLEKAYGVHFTEPRVMDLGLLYRALAAKQVDIVAGNSTDGPIRSLGFTVLEDDRHYFPPYDAVPLFRDDSLQLHPEIQTAMDRLAGKVSAAEMQTMNDAVDGRHEDAAEVVRRFRARKGL